MSELMQSTAPTPHFSPPLGDTLIRLSEVEIISGLRRSHLYKLMGESEFPRPTKIGTASRWSLREVQGWIADKLSQRDAVRGTVE
jgi:predicted DNA-binding transcriptional regulator AlpA